MRSRREIEDELDRLRPHLGTPAADVAWHGLHWVLGEEPTGPYEAFVAEDV
jgi:hypothetical protein